MQHLLNGNGYDNAKITNNTYTNCDYAGFFSNLSTVIINSDSANTTQVTTFQELSMPSLKMDLYQLNCMT
ncbi:MAG: hypothetical protein IPG53_15755 [Ignavibacteriales bacterium]|nr:hypothetical protein [Ignavibacteriales bacterium]